MNMRKFLSVTSGTIIIGGSVGYLMSDKNNFVRTDIKDSYSDKSLLKPDERDILYLASLAPSGHNTQPWFINILNHTTGLSATIKPNGFPLLI